LVGFKNRNTSQHVVQRASSKFEAILTSWRKSFASWQTQFNAKRQTIKPDRAPNTKPVWFSWPAWVERQRATGRTTGKAANIAAKGQRSLPSKVDLWTA
jgi:hypothetical protein